MADPQFQQPNIIGQTSIDFYTVILLGFPISVGVSQQDVLDLLEQAAGTLIKTFPFLAGRVIVEDRNTQSSGTYRIIPIEPQDGISPLRVKDYSGLSLSFDDIAKARAPTSMLDGDLFTPKQGLPKTYDPATEETPVFVVQANFVEGGLLLCSACHHNAIDMNGQGKLIHHFARACRGEPVALAKLGASHAIPLLREGEVQLPHEIFQCPSRLDPKKAPPATAPIPAPWRYYRFPHKKLVELKRVATKAEGDVPWVSTNDAVTAFVWQRVSCARLTRISPNQKTQTMRILNAVARLRPPMEDEFIGMLAMVAGFEFSDIVNAPLSSVANTLRRSLLGVDDHYIRSLATLIHSLEDKTTIDPGASIKAGNDLIVSSWADLGLSSCGFGELLGMPAFVRRPNMRDCEGLTYLMPRTLVGDIDIIISLREEDFGRLEEDETWKEFTEKIG